MRESEFLDLLRYYFRNAKPSEVKEILADYEAHFEEGKRKDLLRRKSPRSSAVRKIYMIPTSPKASSMKRRRLPR